MKWSIAGATAVVLGTTAFVLLTRNKDEEEIVEEGQKGERPQDGDMPQDGGKPDGERGDREGGYKNEYDLDLEDIRDTLESDGLRLGIGMGIKLSIEENGSTGAFWSVKPGSCADLVDITEDYVYEEVFDDFGFPLDGAPGTKFFELSGKAEGECTFEAALAQEWLFDWEINPEEYWDKL